MPVRAAKPQSFGLDVEEDRIAEPISPIGRLANADIGAGWNTISRLSIGLQGRLELLVAARALAKLSQ
jgi:hypothetical protein